MRKVGDRRFQRVYLDPGIYPHVNGDFFEVEERLVANRVERLEKRRVLTGGGKHYEDDKNAVWTLVGFEIIGEIIQIDAVPKKSWWRRILASLRRRSSEPTAFPQLPEARDISKDNPRAT